MKTILVILLSILACIQFYLSDPLILTAPFNIGSMLCMLSIGLILGSFFKQRGLKKQLRIVRKLNNHLTSENGKLMALKLEYQKAKFEKSANIIEACIKGASNIVSDFSQAKIKEQRQQILSLQGNFAKLQKRYNDLKKERDLSDKLLGNLISERP